MVPCRFAMAAISPNAGGSARWLGVPNGRGPDGLLREFSIITLADLSRGALPEVPRATAAARQAQLKDRGIDYGRRFGK